MLNWGRSWIPKQCLGPWEQFPVILSKLDQIIYVLVQQASIRDTLDGAYRPPQLHLRVLQNKWYQCSNLALCLFPILDYFIIPITHQKNYFLLYLNCWRIKGIFLIYVVNRNQKAWGETVLEYLILRYNIRVIGSCKP